MQHDPQSQAARLTFTKITVTDLERMKLFYEEVFGLATSAKLHATGHLGALDEYVLESRDGARLILVKWLERDAPPAGEVTLGFRITDIDALFGRARNAGATVVSPPARSDDSGGLVVGVFSDPEGHLCEVVTET